MTTRLLFRGISSENRSKKNAAIRTIFHNSNRPSMPKWRHTVATVSLFQDGSARPKLMSRSSSRNPPAERRILIVDKQPLIRRGLATLIDHEPDLGICAGVATLKEALEAIVTGEPHLVITDFSHPFFEGSNEVRAIVAVHKTLPVLVHTMHHGVRFARRAFRAGASGYVSKQETGEVLLTAILAVLAGEKNVLSPTLQTEFDA